MQEKVLEYGVVLLVLKIDILGVIRSDIFVILVLYKQIIMKNKRKFQNGRKVVFWVLITIKNVVFGSQGKCYRTVKHPDF